MTCEVSLQETWDSDEISSTAIDRVDMCEKVVKMGSEDSHAFQHSAVPSTENHRDKEHCIRQDNDRNINDEEPGSLSTVELGVAVDEGHNHG
jgi:hypothetical protein